jgi:tetratricopeptide (TPR) repeat protein
VRDGMYAFRHELVREALADRLAPHTQAAVHRTAAERLSGRGARPGRIAEHWVRAGEPDRAVEFFVEAAREAIRVGGYTAAVRHLDAALAHSPGHPDARRLRAAALDALGDFRALAAYDAAIEVAAPDDVHELRPLQALAQIKMGDPVGALETIAGAEPRTLDSRLAQALTYSGAALLGATTPERGSALSAAGRTAALRAGDPSAVIVAAWSNAAAAHARGELRDTLRIDLADTHALPRLAVTVFDGQLCITQRLLYGNRPYDDVIGFADAFAAESSRLGAARGVAFATTLRGEAELLCGRLADADRDLEEGTHLHRAIDAATGESFALQRRAEVALAVGDRERARRLLDESLAIARGSDVGFHLFDRIYGTRIALATDPAAAYDAALEAEEAVRGPFETCPGCRITLEVPAAIAIARAGDLDRLARFEQSCTFLANVVMHLPAWDAALEEVRAHACCARGEAPQARAHFAAAAAGFAAAGQPLDARRCSAQVTRLAV